MKAIFLDIDGCLNDHRRDETSGSGTLLRPCVREFNRLLADVPDAVVVLSSAWRYMILGGSMTLKGFAHLLRTHGVCRSIESRLVGHTCSDEEVPTRGGQVRRWLDGAAGVESFVVLDDCPPGLDFAPVLDRVVKVDGRRGLSAATRRAAAVMLVRREGNP